MQDQPKYSVIVPVYNAQETLHRCVDSILDQNYRDMELILVNDGSGDDSGKICEAYRDSCGQVVYIDKPNGGVSSARNAGLDAAKGTYVLFVDSDDYVSPHYFSALDEQCGEYDYDCVFFSHAVVKGETAQEKKLRDFAARDTAAAVPKFCEALYCKYLSHPINKRFKRKIIAENQLRFPEHLYVGEDKTFSLKYIMYCGSCLVLSDVLYYVNVDNPNSLSRKPRPDLEQQLDMLTAQTRETICTADIPEEYRQQYIAAENLIQLRGVYSETKRMHLAQRDRKFRRRRIKQLCGASNAERVPLPGGMFSRLLQIPVRWKLVTVIDLMGWYLAR